MTGYGQKALRELVSKYNKVTDEANRAQMEKRVNSNMKHGDLGSSFMKKTLACSELDKMGETISDRIFKDILYAFEDSRRSTRTSR